VEAGNSYGQNNLGVCYKNGKGVKIDSEKAFQWYQKAAKAGNSNAQYNVAFFYEIGQGVEIDLEKAFQ